MKLPSDPNIIAAILFVYEGATFAACAYKRDSLVAYSRILCHFHDEWHTVPGTGYGEGSEESAIRRAYHLWSAHGSFCTELKPWVDRVKRISSKKPVPLPCRHGNDPAACAPCYYSK